MNMEIWNVFKSRFGSDVNDDMDSKFDVCDTYNAIDDNCVHGSHMNPPREPFTKFFHCNSNSVENWF